jgi:hypothetical protein
MRIIVRSVRADRRGVRGAAPAAISRNTVNLVTTHCLSMRGWTVQRSIGNLCAALSFRMLPALRS